MNRPLSHPRRVTWLIFAVTFFLAIGWAFTTFHVWEDYFITFRSSKNLAMGHGLVFNEGDRLHTFTSPLGVLLPALASLLTGNHSDEIALWLFRGWSGLAFAGAAVLLYALVRRLQYGAWTALAIVAILALDAKSLDFCTNGMETGFFLLFIAYTIWAMFVCRSKQTWHLGVAWGGLMWTRPDSFLYIGLLAAGTFLFNDPHRTGLTRVQLLGLFVKSGLVCAVVYLPWFAWAWVYYGTPVPNTITAKGGVSGGGKSALGVLKTFLNFPWTVWLKTTSLESTFMPSYFQFGGWPLPLLRLTQAVSLFVSFQWVLPWWRSEVRAASFAFCGLHCYLSYFPYFPFPWYLPGTLLLATIVLGGIADQLIGEGTTEKKSAWQNGFRYLAIAGLAVGLATEGWTTWQMNRQMKAEQIYSTTGVRRKVGEWLRTNAQPTDTVFMEPLGNIGFYSGLKTYDFPGLSSREMVEAIRFLGTDWANLVEYLSPDWLVLRPHERQTISNSNHRIFDDRTGYKLVQEFNNLDAIKKLDTYGRQYIEFDAHLLVYRRQVPSRYKLDFTQRFPFENLHVPVVYIDGHRMYTVHAAGMVSLKVPPHAQHMHIGYGLPEATYVGDATTDGVDYGIYWTDGRKSQPLLNRFLDPLHKKEDRGAQFFDVDLPHSDREATILLRTGTGGTDGMDWSSWEMPEFK